MNFMVVRLPSPYNGIIGRPGVRKIRAIPSTTHEMIKFPVAGGIVTLRSSKIILLEFSMVSELGVPQHVINQVTEEKIQVAIHPGYLEQTIPIGSTLTEEGRKELCGSLRRHLDVFAWKPADMIGVPRNIAEHRLNVREGCLPVRQKKKGQAPERNKAISEEVKNWRMCVDFKDLNKVFPKDGYPLPELDWKVESLCGYPYKCFLDAYKRYHQIKMAEEDEEKTTFITSQGIFCYSKIPFGLKNAEATYQRLVDKAFQKETGRNLKVYVDDLVIKSRTEKKVIRDIEETFKTLREINIKLNPKKAEVACKEMKQLISELPMLTASKEKEEIIMYLEAAKEAISAVLMTERDGKQVPIYFVSRALQGPEINYTLMEKLILALVSDNKWLKRYFQAHTILEITDQPIKQLLSNPEVTERLLKWRFELGEHDIQYRPRTSVKGQIMADFIVELQEDDTPDTSMEDREELPDPWILFTDASSCIDGSGAEYEALIAGLQITGKMGAQILQANVDSKLIANKINGIYIAKESSMIKYLEKANHVLREIHEGSCSMHAGPRSVVAKALRSGYYWPTMRPDARNLIRECNDCQVHHLVPRNPQEKLTPITSPWPIYKWGIDIVGPFSEGPGKSRITEPWGSAWISWRKKESKLQYRKQEAKPKWKDITTLGSETQASFQETLSTRTTKQAMRKKGASSDLSGRDHTKSQKHWANEQKANKSLEEGIKARLGDKNKNRVEEISHVLWAHRTMIKPSNGETPFSLTYGAKVVIPAEIGMPTLRNAEVDIVKNNGALGISLDLLEEKREQVAVQEARSKAKMERYYNAMVRNTSFHPRDFVYQNNKASHAKEGGKLRPKWEGPYEVTKALGKGTYMISDLNGHTLSRS
nr:reverse transcriptase domain-containing protein [Tanacetum cinerariifolium]